MSRADGSLLDLARRALDAARDGEAVEAYVIANRTASVHARDGVPERLVQAETWGLGVRVVREGRLGYAYAADPDPADLGEVVGWAREYAAWSSPDEANVLPEPAPLAPIEGLLAPELETLAPERKVQLAIDVERLTREADPRIRALRRAYYSEIVLRAALASTAGVAAEAETGTCSVAAAAVAGDGDEMQMDYGYRFARRPDDLDVEAAAREAADRACRLLGGRQPRTERLPVLLDPRAAGVLLAGLGRTLNGDEVLKGRSLFAGRTGERVASEALTVFDDGRDLRGTSTFPFDDEGTPTRRTPLVEAGMLRGFLHCASTAARAGTRSTGNGVRAGSFKTPPTVAPTTLVIHPGSDAPETLLARAGRALYIQGLTGVHSGVNTVSGDVSVGVSGLRLEGGSFGEPVREATIAGNLLDILSAVEAVGDDLQFLPDGVASPTILIREMTVAGA